MPNDPYQILDPQLAADQIALQRKMALAQALRQQSMQGLGDTQMLGGVAIQKSPLEGISKLFQGYTANKMDEQSDASRMAMAKRQAAALDSLFGNPSNVSPPSVGAAATDIPAYLNGTANQNTLPNMAGFQQAQTQMPQQQNSGYSLTGNPQKDRMLAALMGPDKYMELYAKNYEPTNEMRNFNAPGQFGQLQQTKLYNDATMKMDQGATYRMPNGQERYMPKIGEGIIMNGGVASQVPNYARSNAAIQGAQAGAQAYAQESAKDRFAVPTLVNLASGPVMMTPAQQRFLANGGSGQAGIPLQTEQQKAYAQGSTNKIVDYENSLNDKVVAQNSLMEDVTKARQFMPLFKQGGGEGGYMAMAKMAQGVPGVPQEMVDQIARGNLGAAETFDKIMAKQVILDLKQMVQGSGGRILKTEFDALRERYPNPETDPRAIKEMFQMIEDEQKRTLAEQQGFNQFKQSGQPLDQWQSQWAQQANANRQSRAQPVITHPQYPGFSIAR